jgi:hypothetical protein
MILFLKGVYISKIINVEDTAELYFQRYENQQMIHLNESQTHIQYGKIPAVFTNLADWNIVNVCCWKTGILLNGKHPFIPLSIKKIPVTLHDDLNKLNIKELNKLEKVENVKAPGKKSKKVVTVNTSHFKEKIHLESIKEKVEIKQEYTVEIKTLGVFYNFNVALNFINESDWSDSDKWERIQLLKQLHFIWYKKEMRCIGIIPPVYSLVHYGGDRTIEDYTYEI